MGNVKGSVCFLIAKMGMVKGELLSKNNKMGIDLADHVNDLIIKSIKTKLEILKN